MVLVRSLAIRGPPPAVLPGPTQEPRCSQRTLSSLNSRSRSTDSSISTARNSGTIGGRSLSMQDNSWSVLPDNYLGNISSCASESESYRTNSGLENSVASADEKVILTGSSNLHDISPTVSNQLFGSGSRFLNANSVDSGILNNSEVSTSASNLVGYSLDYSEGKNNQRSSIDNGCNFDLKKSVSNSNPSNFTQNFNGNFSTLHTNTNKKDSISDLNLQLVVGCNSQKQGNDTTYGSSNLRSKSIGATNELSSSLLSENFLINAKCSVGSEVTQAANLNSSSSVNIQYNSSNTSENKSNIRPLFSNINNSNNTSGYMKNSNPGRNVPASSNLIAVSKTASDNTSDIFGDSNLQHSFSGSLSTHSSVNLDACGSNTNHPSRGEVASNGECSGMSNIMADWQRLANCSDSASNMSGLQEIIEASVGYVIYCSLFIYTV